jgi:hypothetical protein
MEQYLTARKVTMQYARDSGLKYVDGATAHRERSPKRKEAILIPLLHPFTREKHKDITRFRYLCDPLPKDRHGKIMKFGQPDGSGVEAFFDSHVDWKRGVGEVYITEGEIKSLSMNSNLGVKTIGLLGVDMHGSGDEFPPWMAEVLKGVKKAVLCWDNDEANPKKPGLRRSKHKLADKLRAHGIEPWAVSIPWNGAKLGWDDYIAKHGKAAALKLLKTAKPITEVKEEAIVIHAKDAEDENVKWLWRNYVPLQMLSGLGGDMGEGKSTITLSIAAAGSKGREPFGKGKVKPFHTLIVTNENIHAVATWPKFRAMGGNDDYLHALDGIKKEDGTVRSVTFDDVEIMRAEIRKWKVKLVVFDPIQSFLNVRDGNQAVLTRPKLDKIMRLAKEENVAILILSHVGKIPTTRAVNALLGSVDIGAACRQIMLAGSNLQGEHTLLLPKHNVGPEVVGRSYQLIRNGEPGKKGIRTMVVWGGESRDDYAALRASQLQKKKEEKGEEPKQTVEEVREWLRSNLKTKEENPNGTTLTELEDASNYKVTLLQKASTGIVEKGRVDGQPVWWLLPRARSEALLGKSRKYAKPKPARATVNGSGKPETLEPCDDADLDPENAPPSTGS